MKKILPYFFLIFSVGIFVFVFLHKNFNNNKNLIKKQTNDLLISPTAKRLISTAPTLAKISEKIIFVPYWNLSENLDLNSYDKIVYFSVKPQNNGEIIKNQGYINLEKFTKETQNLNQQKILTIQMTDTEINNYLLKNPKNLEKTINNVLNIAKDYKFNGIALDLELFNILDSIIIDQINNLVQKFYLSAKKENLNFYLILYGDIFYRKRSFDVANLVNLSDGIWVMAYDFHKSRGEPGPNFPFQNKAKYGYDFQLMIDDFLKVVPTKKITVIFGMFGYDWSVDEKKRPIKPAQALTLKEIKNKFLIECRWKDCLIKRDPKTKETEINYIIPTMVDNFINLDYHIVWFEDEQSVKVKTDYLKSRGIGSIAYWAYGYF